MKIGIIGGGYVGLHTAIRLSQANNNWEIKIFDTNENKIEKFNNRLSPIDDFYMEEFFKQNAHKLNNIEYINSKEYSDFDCFFIALSTNPSDDNEFRLNTDLIFSLSKKIISDYSTPVIIRSTINLDDEKELKSVGIGYWPEFLSQGVETSKNINQEVNILSYPDETETVSEIFEYLFKNKIMIKTSISEAIYIKLVHNAFDAHLINLTNLFANIAEENGVNFDNIKSPVETLLKNRNKVKRPGIGYGGSCYPKDSKSLIEITKNKNNIDLIEALDSFNKSQSFAFLTKEKIIRGAKKIIVLGTSFKGGTNDVTKTPTISLRKWLIENNIKYKIWEPNIRNEELINGETISNNIENDINESDLVIISSDWKEFKNLIKEYKGIVIDLKDYIDDVPNRQLYKIGRK